MNLAKRSVERVQRTLTYKQEHRSNFDRLLTKAFGKGFLDTACFAFE